MSIARSDDVSLAYSVEGSGDDVVLLVMGLGGRASDWGTRFPAALAARHRVVRFDNRGTGASDKPRDAWTMDDMARDAVAVLDAVGAERAHVVGVSMGGMISQQVALDHPERVRRLVLMSTHFGGPEVIRPDPEIASIYRPTRDKSMEDVMRDAMRRITGPGFAETHPEDIETLVRQALAQPTPKTTFASQLQAILSSDRSARVAEIRAPTLVVHGDRDPLIPVNNGRALAARIPTARLAILPGHGHLLAWEAPDALSGMVLDFLHERRASP